MMMARLTVQIEGFAGDHADEHFEVVTPVCDVLQTAITDGLITEFKGDDDDPDAHTENPTYGFTVAGLKDQTAKDELRRRAQALATSGPENILECEVD